MYGKNVTQSSWTPFSKKPSNLYNTGQAVCGARGCTRACMVSLESRGVLTNKFHQKFRRRPVWTVDWEKAPMDPPGAVYNDQRTQLDNMGRVKEAD
jgi:hypothetical protein